MKVYTYYDNIEHADLKFSGQDRLLTAWQSSWSDKGFTPVILNDEDAKKNKFYDEYISKLRDIHKQITNVPLSQYGLSCYLRWLAYTTIDTSQPVYVMDYDIINTGINTNGLSDFHDQLKLFSFCCPCFVSGTPTQFMWLCEQFVDISEHNIRYIKKQHQERNHPGNCYHDNEFFIYNRGILSDQIFFSRKDPMICGFMADQDMSNKLVHVSHNSAQQFKRGNNDRILFDIDSDTIKSVQKKSINDIRLFIINSILN